MQKIFFFCLLLFWGFGLMESSGCYSDNLQELHPELLLNDNCDTTGEMSFKTHIQPILAGSCGATNSCHNASGAGGGYVLENYAGVKDAVNTGAFLSAIIWDGNASQMPKDSPSKINDCAITKIQKWIDAGALNN